MTISISPVACATMLSSVAPMNAPKLCVGMQTDSRRLLMRLTRSQARLQGAVHDTRGASQGERGHLIHEEERARNRRALPVDSGREAIQQQDVIFVHPGVL